VAGLTGWAVHSPSRDREDEHFPAAAYNSLSCVRTRADRQLPGVERNRAARLAVVC